MNSQTLKDGYEAAVLKAQNAASAEMWEACAAWSNVARAYAAVLDPRAFTGAAELVSKRGISPVMTVNPGKPPADEVQEVPEMPIEMGSIPDIPVGISPETNAGSSVPPPPGQGKGGKVEPCAPCAEKKARRKRAG